MKEKELKYSIIKTEKQYKSYCKIVRELLLLKIKSKIIDQEIELLTFLIEKWQEDTWNLPEMNPIEVLKYFMKEHKMQSIELVKILGISKGYVSDILNYKKGLSKNVIRKLSERFNLKLKTIN